MCKQAGVTKTAKSHFHIKTKLKNNAAKILEPDSGYTEEEKLEASITPHEHAKFDLKEHVEYINSIKHVKYID